MKLSARQRQALIHAYAPGYSIALREYPEDSGFAPRTLRSLERRGLLRPGPGGSLTEAEPTTAGRAALGLAASAPAALADIVLQAVDLLMGGEVDEIYLGDDVPSHCVEEDWANDTYVWTDTRAVLAAVRIQGLGSGWCDPLEDPDVLLDAVARRITECGYPVEVERYGTLVYFLMEGGTE
jgi:hypothetical protein